MKKTPCETIRVTGFKPRIRFQIPVNPAFVSLSKILQETETK